ncbi:hypothetical protein HanRHA438_Chr02g0092861 [Helianthus annuus]|nr:hypothetical protein HanRHA438_Chr02g0092861 [Helianthus annuus]
MSALLLLRVFDYPLSWTPNPLKALDPFIFCFARSLLAVAQALVTPLSCRHPSSVVPRTSNQLELSIVPLVQSL